jgi:hypothetical protein
MPVINPLQALVHPQTQKHYPAWIVNPQPQLLRIRIFFGKQICRLGIVDSIFQAIDELVYSKNPNLLI